MNVYKTCPVFTTPRFTLRLVREEDIPGLLAVYSDPQAQPVFNADNCTSDFCYRTLAEMSDCMHMWLWSYGHGDFVRWTILEGNTPVGTVEMFRRDDGDDGRGCGVLRIDLLSSCETEPVLDELLDELLQPVHELFGCGTVLTKAPDIVALRQASLQRHGFTPAAPLTGHDGTTYGDYWQHRA